MHPRYNKACNEMDASVFNGELVSDPRNRAGFKHYLERWNQAVEEADKRNLRDELKRLFSVRGTISYQTLLDMPYPRYQINMALEALVFEGCIQADLRWDQFTVCSKEW